MRTNPPQVGAPGPVGQRVLSGSGLLHCEQRGVWMRRGEMQPE